MNEGERSRLDVVEGKLDQVLIILNDPEFGVRPKLREFNSRIRALELKFYALGAGMVGAIVLLIQGGIKGA